jgi:hypothetical protein
VPQFEPLAAQVEAIADALAGDPSVAATGEEGARALALVEQAHRRLNAATAESVGAEKL